MHSEGPGQLLGFLPGDLPLSLQVALVADQQEDDTVRLDVAPGLLQPVMDVLEGAAVCDVKEQEPTHRVTVVGPGDWSVYRWADRFKAFYLLCTCGVHASQLYLELDFCIYCVNCEVIRLLWWRIKTDINKRICTWISPVLLCPRSAVWFVCPVLSPPGVKRSPPPRWDQTPGRSGLRWTSWSDMTCRPWNRRRRWDGTDKAISSPWLSNKTKSLKNNKKLLCWNDHCLIRIAQRGLIEHFKLVYLTLWSHSYMYKRTFIRRGNETPFL